jgi:transcriptional regulator with XRE-family HTH domain
MTFGEKLQQLRERAGLSQSQLATASGVPVWTLRGYEQGRREPLWHVLFKLAAAIGVSCEAFADCVNGATTTPAKGRRAGAAGSAPRRSRGRKGKGA